MWGRCLDTQQRSGGLAAPAALVAAVDCVCVCGVNSQAEMLCFALQLSKSETGGYNTQHLCATLLCSFLCSAFFCGA
jgi:hypothetical protein